MLPALTNRTTADNLDLVVENGAAFVRHKKRGQPEQVYRARVEPKTDSGYTIVAAESMTTLGKQRLAINNNSPGGSNRRLAGRALAEFNVDLDVNKAGRKYGTINQLKGKEVHHMLEIDGTTQYLGAMDPQTQRRAAAQALSDGFTFGDHKNNQTALYGDPSNIPGPRTAAGNPIPVKSHPGKGEHQTADGVHQKVDNIMAQYNMPNMNSPEAVYRSMQGKSPEQQLGMFAAFTQASRLGVQQQKGIAQHAQRKTTLKLEAGLAKAYLPLSPESQLKADAYVEQQLKSRVSRRQ